MNREQLLIDLGIVDANKPELSRINVQILNEYSNAELAEAVTYAVSNCSYAIKVADIVKYFQRKSKEAITKAAERAYRLLCQSCTTYEDMILDDGVAGKTIKALYGSPQLFNERPLDATNSDYALKNFIERYIALADEPLQQSDYYFAGRQLSSCTSVEFIGNYDECLSIAKQVYQNRNVRLPKDPNVKSLPKAVNNERVLSKEESRKVMEDLMEYCAKVKNHD